MSLITPAKIDFSIFQELPWNKLCFVDVETTGSAPPYARVTEVAVVSYPLESDEPVHSWSSLVDPGISIPPEIRFLTGISNEMVRDAPKFASLVDKFEQLLVDGLFVAHHARFDFGFIKHEFERAGKAWPSTIKTLCTVRLSRLLDADKAPHSLDAIRIRYRLPSTDRHRALGDAMALKHFFEALCAKHGEKAVLLGIKRLMQMPSLPAHLPPDCLTNIPHTAGVYFFYGENNHPLYIGKSVDLRARVASHFGQDHKSERGIRLASEIRRIEYLESPDELCALIKEQQLIATLSPSYNVALRKKQNAVLVKFDFQAIQSVQTIQIIAAEKVSLEEILSQKFYGPFSSKSAAKKALTELAHAAQLCLPSLGLEKRTKALTGTPCFARQVMRCLGACCTDRNVSEDYRALEILLEPLHIKLEKDDASIPVQLADGQWVRYAQIVEAPDADWQSQTFSPTIYSLLTSKHARTTLRTARSCAPQLDQTITQS
jgi:DNA polymerase III subunit epsilon